MTDSFVLVPIESPNDPTVRLVEWTLADGERTRAGETVALMETTKVTFEVAAPADGYLFHLRDQDAQVNVGDAIGVIRPVATPPARERRAAPPESEAEAEGPLITRKAQELLDRHGIDPAALAGAGEVIRSTEVERFLARRQASEAAGDQPRYRGEPLDPAADWDRFLDHGLRSDLQDLRRRMMARFRRHVPTGTLLSDRWELAEALGFGADSSVYDECLILGDVQVGKGCWIGPFTVLDGRSARLTIGDHAAIGSGAQLYTHHAIGRTLTGLAGKPVAMASEIGACCFISPLAVIGPGTVIGDHSFVASHSYVEGRFPSHSYLAGNPARRVGRVEIRGDKAFLIRDEDGRRIPCTPDREASAGREGDDELRR